VEETLPQDTGSTSTSLFVSLLLSGGGVKSVTCDPTLPVVIVDCWACSKDAAVLIGVRNISAESDTGTSPAVPPPNTCTSIREQQTQTEAYMTNNGPKICSHVDKLFTDRKHPENWHSG